MNQHEDHSFGNDETGFPYNQQENFVPPETEKTSFMQERLRDQLKEAMRYGEFGRIHHVLAMFDTLKTLYPDQFNSNLFGEEKDIVVMQLRKLADVVMDTRHSFRTAELAALVKRLLPEDFASIFPPFMQSVLTEEVTYNLHKNWY